MVPVTAKASPGAASPGADGEVRSGLRKNWYSPTGPVVSLTTIRTTPAGQVLPESGTTSTVNEPGVVALSVAGRSLANGEEAPSEERAAGTAPVGPGPGNRTNAHAARSIAGSALALSPTGEPQVGCGSG